MITVRATVVIDNITYGLGFEHNFPSEPLSVFFTKYEFLYSAILSTLRSHKARGVVAPPGLQLDATDTTGGVTMTEGLEDLGQLVQNDADAIVTALEDGDHTEAKNQITKLQKHLTELSNALNEAPEPAGLED